MPAGITAALGAVLHDASVFAGGFDQDATFFDVVAEGFFDINILAGLAGPDRHQRMPVVRRGDAEHVEVFVFESLADILNTNRRTPLLFLDTAEVFGEGSGIGIDQVSNLDARQSQKSADVSTTATVQPGNSDTHSVIGAQHAPRSFCAADPEARRS
jgi:hypothetical protein